MSGEVERLRSALTEKGPGVLEAWLASLGRHSFALRGRSDLLPTLRERCGAILEGLEEGLRGATSLALGGTDLREMVERLAFTCGWLAGQGVSIDAALALAYGLGDALTAVPEGFARGLAVVAAESHSSGARQALEARHRAVMEKSQVVCLLDERLPCLFLVGDPDRQALDEAFGRLMMLVVMRDASVVIVDLACLFLPEATVPEALAIYGDYRHEPAPRLILSGVTPPIAEQLRRLAPPPGTALCEELVGAIAASREAAAR
ncbi:MAG: hypothetical protein IT371_13465 [Deltaproteobacteria bacterium]|nr:hypothetical protein [Deltaproteobacteria bacterium]